MSEMYFKLYLKVFSNFYSKNILFFKIYFAKVCQKPVRWCSLNNPWPILIILSCFNMIQDWLILYQPDGEWPEALVKKVFLCNPKGWSGTEFLQCPVQYGWKITNYFFVFFFFIYILNLFYFTFLPLVVDFSIVFRILIN